LLGGHGKGPLLDVEYLRRVDDDLLIVARAVAKVRKGTVGCDLVLKGEVSVAVKFAVFAAEEDQCAQVKVLGRPWSACPSQG